ncbi:MAG: ATP-dependent helicase [Pseudonocardiaceae bacterium]
MTFDDQVLRDDLTPEQYDAAVAPEREVLALACAGSGKSRTLAYRIARLIALGHDPDGIVAFTFTDKAAESIKLRVASALGRCGLDPALVGAMSIGTIHGWCRTVLGRLDARYRQFETLDEMRFRMYVMSRYSELLKDIRGLREAHPRGGFRAPYFETIKQLCEAYKLTNEELLDPIEVAAQDPALGQVLGRLDELLERDHFIDFTTMIRRVVDALAREDDSVVRAVGNLRHLLVDEYQDVNPLQERLIRLLHDRGSALFVVGDDDQAIYAWRGADVSNILTFRTRYPAAVEHTLSHNFRSTPAIVQTADTFAAAELGAARLVKNPVATSTSEPRDLVVLWFNTREEEAKWIADRIADLLGTAYLESDGKFRGLTPADFAILMRSTRGGEQNGTQRQTAFTDALNARGITYTLEAGGGPFDRPQASALRQAFELLRAGNPNRDHVRRLFDEQLILVFPSTDFGQLTAVYSEWGRRIHQPIVLGAARQRLYPQQLLQEMLAALGIARTDVDAGVMADLGVFSRILQDAETVYVSIDSADRFTQLLNFLQNVAEDGYDVQAELMARPDAVTVATVHKMKGLEFPAVFIADVEAQRFPPAARGYSGWLPDECMAPILARGAYGGPASRNGEARLFYTAMTRAERYLYVSGAANLPGGKRARRISPYVGQLHHSELRQDTVDPGVPPLATPAIAEPRRRGDASVLPTTYSQIRYYLRCPHDYRLRTVYGFSPPIVEMFGYGQTIHAAVGKLHEQFPDHSPSEDEARCISDNVFHLKHVPPSREPETRPGAYENAKQAAAKILASYARDYVDDFLHQRQVERPFEVPVKDAVISGAIDLLLRLDDDGHLADASVIDFKAMEGGPDPTTRSELDWGDLSLQVQLYARGATQVLGENARTGSVHLLKDGQRVEVPVDASAVTDAVANVEWAVARIIDGDFPMRPSPSKCAGCDFKRICPQRREEFTSPDPPPDLHLPDGQRVSAPAFSDVVDS